MGEELTRNTGTLQAYVKQPAVVMRFEQVLGAKRMPGFLSSLIQLANGSDALKRCDPQSIISAAMTAATMDLPLQKDLGFAAIVPYGNQAQFQIMSKGLIQLAMRTSQYRRMNAVAINAECFKGYDEIGEPNIDWSELDDAKPIIGYCAGFIMVNGYTKIVYWSKTKVLEHAKRYSKAYRYALEHKDKQGTCLWFTQQDAMGVKTVLKATLSKWGILSVEMQQAMQIDQAVIGEDGQPVYVDNADDSPMPDAPATGSRTEQAAAMLKKRGRPAGSVNKPKPDAAQPPAPPVSEPKTVNAETEDVPTTQDAPQDAAAGTGQTTDGEFFD